VYLAAGFCAWLLKQKSVINSKGSKKQFADLKVFFLNIKKGRVNLCLFIFDQPPGGGGGGGGSLGPLPVSPPVGGKVWVTCSSGQSP